MHGWQHPSGKSSLYSRKLADFPSQYLTFTRVHPSDGDGLRASGVAMKPIAALLRHNG